MSLKKALATLLATVMMLSLVSCGSKSNEEAPDDASKPTESAESSGKIKVGFSSAAFSDEWCHNLALAFENLTATEYPEIEATVLDGNIDAEKQINSNGIPLDKSLCKTGDISGIRFLIKFFQNSLLLFQRNLFGSHHTVDSFIVLVVHSFSPLL